MKIKYFPHQPHCFAFGGFDLQMINTLNAVIEKGVDASRLDIWSRDKDFQILHLWGVGPHNYLVIDLAKKAGKKIIATVLLPYHNTVRSKLAHCYRFFQVRQLIHYYKLIDKIVVVNNTQLNVLAKYYKVPISKIQIIPHLISNEYFRIPDFNFSKKYGISDYVLCTGNISSRKNQYNLALACASLNLNLVLIGNVLDGEILYGEKLETLVKNNKNILWIRELPNGSEELVSAYYNCRIYALPSKSETQPIIALEAVAMHKPLILMDREYAYQDYYKGAVLCNSPSVKDIEKALSKIFNKNKLVEENPIILDCRREFVAYRYIECYEELLK
jgi:glycosyltransferase involved in cell wall biosynthesis